MSNFDYKIDLSTYYFSNENKFNIYVDEMTNKVASNVSLPYVISMNIWKSSYTIYLENLSEGCGEIREIVVNGYTTTTTTLNFILTTTKYVPPTTLFTTTTTTTTSSTTITTITTKYVPPTTVATTQTPSTTQPPSTTIPPTISVGSRRWYNTPTSRTLTRQGCPNGCTAGQATYFVESGKYYVDRLEGIDGQGDVDALATQDLNNNAQNYVNNNAPCINCPSTVFFNTAQSITKTKNNCAEGCQGTSVPYPISADAYSSNISVQNANDIAIAANQDNAQINANSNGDCINCPQGVTPLFISVGVADCVDGRSFVSVGAYNGVPFDGGNYEFWIDGEDTTFSTILGRFGLLNGTHTAYVKDSKGTQVSQTFYINCPVETTTTQAPPPCDCRAGYVNINVTYMFTDCGGFRQSGRAESDGLSNICYDTTRSHFGVNLGTESNNCGGCY
jgi:hypothetical protein